MKDSPEQITEEMLREERPVDMAMVRAFNMAPPPMPVFEDMPQLPSYAQALADDELDDLMAAGVQQLHLQKPKEKKF